MKLNARDGGGRGDACDHGFSKRSLAEGKMSSELSWKVKVIIKNKKVKLNPGSTGVGEKGRHL